MTKPLKLIVDDTFEQVLAVQTCLSKILPPDGASKPDRALKALESLIKEDKIRQIMEKIDKNNDILVLHQTSRQIDTGDLILAKLTELTMISKSASESSGKTILKELPLQTQLMLSHSNRGLLFRFSQLPVAAQQKFIAQQEEQLSQFVEQEETTVLEFLSVFDTRERLADQGRHRAEDSCDWILKSRDYLEWAQGNCNRLRLLEVPGSGKTVVNAFITVDLHDRL